MAEETLRRAGEFGGGELEGEYVPMSELVDREITLTKAIEMTTKFGEALGVEFSDPVNFEGGWFITSHVIVSRVIRRIMKADAFPVVAKITKRGVYYTIE